MIPNSTVIHGLVFFQRRWLRSAYCGFCIM